MNTFCYVPQQAKHCSVPTCPRALDALGQYCNFHGKRARRTGSLECANLKSPARRTYIKAARAVLQGSPALHEMTQRLDTCKPFLCRQADVLRRGWTNRERAKAVLAAIHQQRGHEAAVLILSAFLGTASMPMPSGAPRYYKVQVARAIYGLCRSEKQTLYGKTTLHRISLQGYRLAEALFVLVDEVCWPLKAELRQAIMTQATCVT